MSTDSQRSQAKRIRKLGAKASPTQRKWLDAYEAKRDKAKATKADRAIEAQAAVEQAATSEAGTSTPMAAVDFPAEPQVQGDDDDADATPLLNDNDLRQGEGQSANGSSAPGPAPDSPTAIPTPGLHAGVAPLAVCADPNCPACSGMVGAKRCAATGKVVWNPIDDETARGSAMMLLGLVGLIVSFVTKKPPVEPTKEEIAYMGAAIQKSTYRRVNAIGAYDDLLMLGMALGMYANRARLGEEAKQ